MSPRKGYDLALAQMNVDLIKMGALIETAIEDTIKAFEIPDYELAQRIIKKDAEVNNIQKEIESKCLSLIMRQQPIAKDLRDVSAALKIVTDMERIGDHAADIAETVLRMKDSGDFNIIPAIPTMANAARQMVVDAVDSFVKRDLKLANEVEVSDDVVDDLFNQAKHEITEHIKAGKVDNDVCIDLLMIAKYFERIGDHAVNICEWVEFNETGVIRDTKII